MNITDTRATPTGDRVPAARPLTLVPLQAHLTIE